MSFQYSITWLQYDACAMAARFNVKHIFSSLLMKESNLIFFFNLYPQATRPLALRQPIWHEFMPKHFLQNWCTVNYSCSNNNPFCQTLTFVNCQSMQNWKPLSTLIGFLTNNIKWILSKTTTVQIWSRHVPISIQ